MSRRPNRGGGRGYRPPPQRGHHHGQSSGQGNLSRKGASAIDIDEDLAILLEEDSLEEESDDDEWVMDDEVVEEPGSKDPAKPPDTFLHGAEEILSENNINLVTLPDLVLIDILIIRFSCF